MISKNAITTKDVITSWYDFFLQTKWYLETCCFQLLESIIAITAEVLLVESRGLNRPVVVLLSPSLSISVYSGTDCSWGPATQTPSTGLKGGPPGSLRH